MDSNIMEKNRFTHKYRPEREGHDRRHNKSS